MTVPAPTRQGVVPGPFAFGQDVATTFDATTFERSARMTDAGARHPAVWAVEQHAARWNAQDRGAWLSLFADDVVFEDPVGKAPKLGRAAAEGSWDNSFTSGRVWTLHPQRVIPGANEAAVIMHNRGVLHGQEVELEGIEIWKVDDAGKVVHVRAFFEQPTDFELNPFFVPED